MDFRFLTLLLGCVAAMPLAIAAPQVIVSLPPGDAKASALPKEAARWKKDGLVSTILQLQATAQEEPGFSVLLVLDMKDEAALTRWEKSERPKLPATARARGADSCVHAERPNKDFGKALFEVNIYRMKIPAAGYAEYCRDYIAPLMEGQADAGLMPWYTMYIERGPQGESNAVLVKAYRDADTYDQKVEGFKLELRKKLTAEHPTYPKLHAIKGTLRDDVSETLATLIPAK